MPKEYIELIVFGLGQLIILVATISIMKSDTKTLKEQMKGVTAELGKISDILISLANINGRLNVQDERMLAQGKRIDENEKKVNRFLEYLIKIRARQVEADSEPAEL